MYDRSSQLTSSSHQICFHPLWPDYITNVEAWTWCLLFSQSYTGTRRFTSNLSCGTQASYKLFLRNTQKLLKWNANYRETNTKLWKLIFFKQIFKLWKCFGDYVLFFMSAKININVLVPTIRPVKVKLCENLPSHSKQKNIVVAIAMLLMKRCKNCLWISQNEQIPDETSRCQWKHSMAAVLDNARQNWLVAWVILQWRRNCHHIELPVQQNWNLPWMATLFQKLVI